MLGRRRLLVAAGGVAWGAAAAPGAARAQAVAPEAVSLRAADGVAVAGTLYRPAGTPRGVILLFHQAASSRAEYAPIAPELAKLGWSALAIDQRSGGGLFGGRNATAEGVGGDPGYEAALPDLEAALAYARTRFAGQRILAWGSSYSAALVFVLAARHPREVAGVLAFSPGEYLSGISVAGAARKVAAPIFVTSASSEDEIAAAAEILGASPATVKVQFRPEAGTHGASTLRTDSNPSGAAAAWAAVKAFLTRLGAAA